MVEKPKNEALQAEEEYRTTVEEAYDYVENFDILETITNVGNDEVFTPRKTADMMLDSLPEEVWHNPDYKWLNPATKNGIFEREIAIRLDRGLADVIPDVETRRKHILQKMIFSIGQTKFTANVARRTIYYCSQANRACDGIKAPDGHYVNGYAIGNGTWFDDEEGNIKTPCTDHEYVDAAGRQMPRVCEEEAKKKYHCKHCGIGGDSKYNDVNQREKYAYEFIHVHHLNLRRHLQDRFLGGNRAMKFDIIIGNPPYQLDDGGAGVSARPIYHLFIEQAKALNPKYLCMIIPARWYSGGKGLDDFRTSMLGDDRISKLVDFENFKDVFPTVDLAGGACYFLWDKDYHGKCEVTNWANGAANTVVRSLGEYETFIRQNRAVEIVDKVMAANRGKKSLSDRVSARKPFNLPSNYEPKESGVPCWFIQKIGLKFADKNDVLDPNNYLNKWKFLVPAAPIAGQTDFTKPVGFYYDGNTRISKPGECCTESWLVLGAFETKEETEYFKSYVMTKTVRFLLLQTVVSQHTAKKNFCFIPELGRYDRIYTDGYLCQEWGLSQEDWDYIDSRIGTIKG